MNFKTAYEAYVDNVQRFSKKFNTPKLNELSQEVQKYAQEAQNAYLQMETERLNPQLRPLVSTAQRDFVLLQKKLEKAAEKYNKFLSRQYNAQKAFDRLNNQ